ncbi:arylacetamide deacetylase isoform X2 [Struthio camelus]|uniref:arylacetamide deacetylase isoform X2 n=1 Tax=Struthio camelus TaxID=8801 RepID=UPI00051E2FC9|nr:PREDICTED: arylacetamide deacetylase isoform X1 [Struthio camelus australis]
MGTKSLCLFIASALIAYYIYAPIPENLEDRWKLMLMSSVYKTVGHLAEFAEWLGLMHYMEVLMLITVTEHVPPTSDENVTVTDTEFSNVPVRLYLPRKQLSGLKRAILYFHGGGWCVGEAGMKPYDLLSRWTSNQLNAVVVSVNYRLAPKYHFPVQFEDVYAVTKFFLQSSVLSQYGVDPNRICVAGDSAGGNLAAAVAQQLLDDPEVKTKLKVQALLYPALQTLDLNLPSYQENENKLILPKSLMVRFWSEYFTTDSSLREAMASNRHVPAEASHLFQFVNWSNLLPEELKKDHVYTSPVYGSSNLGKKYPGFLDPRAAPLLAEDAKLHSLPLTYVLTCEHDVLRDDGIMYVSRLREAGVKVTHNHAEDAFHGALAFISSPANLAVGHRLLNHYINWLNDNL